MKSVKVRGRINYYHHNEDKKGQTMFDILASTKQLGVLYGIGSSVAVSGIILWVIKMQISKVVKHVDDRTAHVDPANPLVEEKIYEIEKANIRADVAGNGEAIKVLHRRFDDFDKGMDVRTEKILAAIKENK